MSGNVYMHPADMVMNSKAPYVYIHGKGNKVRTVPVMLKTLEHYKSYIKRFQVDARFINKYTDAARQKHPEIPKHITPHMFRHSRAVSLYRNGMPLPLISEWLGHSDLETTRIYAYADVEMKRRAINKAMKDSHPLYTINYDAEESDDEKLRRYYGLM